MNLYKKYCLIILIIISTGSMFAQSVTVTTPSAAGINLTVGAVYSITWSSTTVALVEIKYSTNSGVNWLPIVGAESLASQDAPAVNSYSWIVPAVISGACEIQINDLVPGATDVSNNVFSIIKPLAPALSAPVDGAVKQVLSPTQSWSAVTTLATVYNIEIAENDIFTIGKKTAAVNSPATSYSAAVLAYNKTYYWRVQAVVGGISSDFSLPISFKTKLSTPTLSSPSDLNNWIATNATLTWNAVAGAENYRLQVSTAVNFPGPLFFDDPTIAATSKAMSGMLNNTQYYWRVKAIQADGNESDYSIVRSFTTIPAPVLTSPANNSLNYGFTKVTYVWASVTNAVSYEIKISKSSDFTSTDTKTYTCTAPTTTSTPTDILEYATKYYWKVNAKVGIINSDYSPTYSFTVGTPLTSIDDADAKVVFDHTKGTISEIIFKNGSGNQLLNSNLNTKNKTGLGRISSEENSKLIAWTEAAGTRTYTYENVLYGSKRLTINWNANGIVLDTRLNLDANKSAVFSPYWLPGGATGPLHDFIIYAGSDDVLSMTNLTYPGTAASLFTGDIVLTAMYDDRFDEFFGFKSTTAVNSRIQQALTFGPTFTYDKSSNPQTIDLSFAIKSEADFFTWAAKKYIVVSTPTASEKVLDQSTQTIKWDAFGFNTNVDIKLSINGGTSFPLNPAYVSHLNDGTEDCTFPNLAGSVPLVNCKIQVSEAAGTTIGSSPVFSIVKQATSVISIASNFTVSPSAEVIIPITITPAGGALVNALDLRLEYDENLLTYKRSTVDLAFDRWTMDVTNNPASGYLQIGGFKNEDGSAVSTVNTIVVVTFTAKATARVGLQTPLRINNSNLSLADGSAKALSVSGQDGLVTFYSGVSGYFRYINTKKPIYVTGGIKFESSDVGINIDGNTNAAGKFEFTNIKPGSDFVLTPKSDLSLPNVITDAVDAVDAARAFQARTGGSVPLTTDLQKIAADVNGDGVVNSTDAFAILQISTGALTAGDFSLSKWVFVDSTFRLTSSNWTTAPQTITYTPLDTMRARQTFWGMIRGDVDGDYSPSTTVALSKLSAFQLALDPNAVIYSTPQKMTVKAGDTLSLPISVRLNGGTVGAFNISLSVNPEILVYANKYTVGKSVPSGTGWSFSTHFDSNGKLNIGATDFAGNIDPINQNGVIGYFNFVVKGGVKLGDTCSVKILNVSSSDSKLVNVVASSSGGLVTVSNTTDIFDENIDFDYSLNQNYPNPFNPSTLIEYSIKINGLVEVDVYNVLGERVTSLINKHQDAGKYKVAWNASQFASGIYFYRIKSGDFVQTRKMILIK